MISNSVPMDVRTPQVQDVSGPVTYVRPGSWEASVGVPGIDQHHTFADPGPHSLGQPDESPGSIDTVGPSAVNDTKAPAQNSRAWWFHHNAGQFLLDNQNGDKWGDVEGEPQPQNDTQRPKDFRTYSLVAPRWTATRGPVTTGWINRESEHNMTGERLFVDPKGASFAYTPTLRPSPMAFGDGLPNIPRFRTTQRVSPVPLDQQIVSDDQQARSGYVLATGPTDLSSTRWW